MISVFRHEHIRDQHLGRQAAFDEAVGRRRLHDTIRASAAGILRATRDDHAQPGWHLVEALGNILADDVQGAAAAWAGPGLWFNDGLFTRQVCREVAAIGAAPGNAITARDVARLLGLRIFGGEPNLATPSEAVGLSSLFSEAFSDPARLLQEAGRLRLEGGV